MNSTLKRYLLTAFVVTLASLVYAGSAAGWRRPQGVPLNALHVCRDGVRFEAGGPIFPVNFVGGVPAGLDGQAGASRLLHKASNSVLLTQIFTSLNRVYRSAAAVNPKFSVPSRESCHTL